MNFTGVIYTEIANFLAWSDINQIKNLHFVQIVTSWEQSLEGMFPFGISSRDCSYIALLPFISVYAVITGNSNRFFLNVNRYISFRVTSVLETGVQ